MVLLENAEDESHQYILRGIEIYVFCLLMILKNALRLCVALYNIRRLTKLTKVQCPCSTYVYTH